MRRLRAAAQWQRRHIWRGGRTRSSGARSSRRGRRSGSPTSSRTTRRAPTSSAAAAASSCPFPVAVKTGTSQAYHDNWTIGYTRRVTVGVWVGNFDRRPLRNSSGVTGAAPIFQAVMLAAHSGSSQRGSTARSRLVARRAATSARLSGELANSWCPVRRREWLPASSERSPCSWHHPSDEGLLVVWPAPFREWARSIDPSFGVRRASAANHGCSRQARQPQRRRRRLQLVNPPPGATYLIDPTLRREFQTLSLRVVAPTRRRSNGA